MPNMQTRQLIPDVPLSLGVLSFLAACDEVREARIPTCATSLIQGRLVLLLGEMYLNAAPPVRAELLRHECGHFVYGHLARLGDRDPGRFNLVCDAAIHETGACDWKLLDRETGGGVITYDRLPHKNGGSLPPYPPEIAYEMLAEPPEQDGAAGEGCGSLSHGEHDNSPESWAKHATTTAGILAADPEFGKAAGAGSGMGRETPELAAPPPWIYQVLDWLTRGEHRTEPRRSWRRENRSGSPLLPGQSRGYGYGARILLDASGSIDPTAINQFLSAICCTPELSGTDVVVFDDGWGDPLPVSDPSAVLAEVKRRGGGTAIRRVGQAMRVPSVTAVWLTDGYSGDGWPDEHDGPEVWVINNTEATPPRGVVVRAC